MRWAPVYQYLRRSYINHDIDSICPVLQFSPYFQGRHLNDVKTCRSVFLTLSQPVSLFVSQGPSSSSPLALECTPKHPPTMMLMAAFTRLK